MQIVTFRVMAIIGVLFALIQALIAGNGALRVDTYYREIYLYVDCDICRKVFV